jgi:hypothetical protein
VPKKKTLHDLLHPGNPPEGQIPHVFHRHGKLQMAEHVVVTPAGDVLNTVTPELKMAAYGHIAAGNSMVPYSIEDKPLGEALRQAVGTRLMNEVGGHEKPPTFEVEGVQSTVYREALRAIQHHGTANEQSVLAAAKRQIKGLGYASQAKLLSSFIEAMVDSAMEQNQAELNNLIEQFHALYGTATKPQPNKPPPIPIVAISIGDLPGDDKEDRDTGIPWGALHPIQRVPMQPWKHPTIRSKRSWKYSEFGVFKYPWRALPSSDYQCFSLARHKYGGTVLVDFSGSMSIDNEQVNALLNSAPYATIAAYGSDRHDSRYGFVVILAEDSKKGLSKSARAYIGSGNVVDGPALQWLAKMPAPRIWVSDGGVTGIHDSGNVELNRDAERIVNQGKIVRIHNMEQLLKQLS